MATQLNPLVGSWVGTYAPLSLLYPAPTTAAEKQQTLQFRPPRLGGDYAPNAAIILFKFASDNTHTGEVRVNFGGTVVLERPFDGTYELRHHSKVDAVVGDIRLVFSSSDPLRPGQINTVYVAMRSHEEMAFMLVETANPAPSPPAPPGTMLPPFAGGAAANGTLKRILPIDFLPE